MSGKAEENGNGASTSKTVMWVAGILLGIISTANIMLATRQLDAKDREDEDIKKQLTTIQGQLVDLRLLFAEKVGNLDGRQDLIESLLKEAHWKVGPKP